MLSTQSKVAKYVKQESITHIVEGKKKPVNRNIPRNDTYRGISRQGLQNSY